MQVVLLNQFQCQLLRCEHLVHCQVLQVKLTQQAQLQVDCLKQVLGTKYQGQCHLFHHH
jgi:hypothetical protein